MIIVEVNELIPNLLCDIDAVSMGFVQCLSQDLDFFKKRSY